MKRCPECRRDYRDDSLSFCLDDGTYLVEGPATAEQVTAMLASDDSGVDSRTAVLSTAAPRLVSSSPIIAGSTSSSNAGSRFDAIKPRKLLFTVAFLTLMLVAGGISFGIYKYLTLEPIASKPFQSIKIERLTSTGKATEAVISPDGRQMVYVVDDAGKRSLWLRQVATTTDVRLTEPTSEWFYWALTTSRDGNFLYYIYGGLGIRNRVLYQMPILGGSPKVVIEDVGSPVGFSHDGKKIAFVRSGSQGSSMMVANIDGTEARAIAKRNGEKSYGSMFTGGVAWTPDDKKIVTVANARDDSGRFQNVIEISVEHGTERPLTSHRWYEIQRLVGLGDGTGALVTAAEKASEFRSRQIWYVPYAGGDPHKVTNDLNNYTSISLNADSSVLVTVQKEESTNIWVAPEGDANRATQIPSLSSRLDGYDGIAWTDDGRIVYTSMAGENEGIWIMDSDGKNRKRLTPPEIVAFFPSVSTDGRYIVFTREHGRTRSVWKMDVDGGNQKQMVDRGGANPQGTEDWIVSGSVWKIPVDGGEPVRINDEGLSRCAVSSDGTQLACQLDTPGLQTRLGIIPIDGGPAKIFDVKFELPARIRWSPDGSTVTFVSRKDGIRDIWGQATAGGEPKKLTNFQSDQIFAFDWSRDGTLVISHGKSESDVVLIRNTK